MQCPKDKSAMRTIPVQNSTFNTCDTCGGIWFDEDELKKTAQVFAWGIPAQVDEFALIIKENDVPEKDAQSDVPFGDGIVCPVDGTQTARFTYAGDSKIVLDRCLSCNGTWFDGDELVRMARYLKPSARNLMGELIAQEMESDEKMKEDIALLPLLPLKIAGEFSSPIALVDGVLRFLVQHAGLDLGFDAQLYK